MDNNDFSRRSWLKSTVALGFATAGPAGIPRLLRAETKHVNSPIDIGLRRELFIDTHLIDRLEGQAEQRLHHPVPREIALVHDAPWEGTGSGYHSVFQDGERYRMYYKAWHVVETKSALAGAANELSLYAVESYWTGKGSALRRYTLRLDGFVSLSAPMSGGEVVTQRLTFSGSQLAMNFATSAAGSVRVEIQDSAGSPVEGFSLADCPDHFGDTVERTVRWKNGSDLSRLAGKPVRLRFVLKDANLYSFRFHDRSPEKGEQP